MVILKIPEISPISPVQWPNCHHPAAEPSGQHPVQQNPNPPCMAPRMAPGLGLQQFILFWGNPCHIFIVIDLHHSWLHLSHHAGHCTGQNKIKKPFTTQLRVIYAVLSVSGITMWIAIQAIHHIIYIYIIYVYYYYHYIKYYCYYS